MDSIIGHNYPDKGGYGRNNYRQSFVEKGMEFIEVWDYVGEASFRGFIAEKQVGRAVEKTLFLFFQELAGLPLKEGLVALIELATDCYACDRLVICLDRKTHGLREYLTYPTGRISANVPSQTN